MATDFEDQVRARLRQARFERGLSLAALAEAAGMTASTISRLETGERRLTLAQVSRLAEALQLSTDDLLVREGVPSPSLDGRLWQPIGPERTRGPRVYRIVLPAGEVPHLHQHEGYQWLYVLAGTVRLVVQDDERVLHEAESAGFHTWRPHWIGALERPAEALIIFSPEGEPLFSTHE